MPRIVGGCLCGNVRYSSDADPAFVGVCHCKDCQKFTGSAFAAVVGVWKSSLTVRGMLATFSKTGDTGKSIYRRFCSRCGSSVMDEAEALSDVVMLGAGTLDDPNWVKPSMQIYCDSAQSWVQLGRDIKSSPRMPG